MTLPLSSAPKSICILRLSAVGDISHTLPLVRTIQTAWPQTKLTWIIGKTEYKLVSDMDQIQFILFDKSQPMRSYLNIARQLRQQYFDVLIHLQMSLRASLLSLLVKSPIKLGFDKQRAKDMQWLFTNHQITYQPQQHVIDSFLGFSQCLGITTPHYEWSIPIPQHDLDFAKQTLSHNQPVIVISPCSSMAYRNWSINGYAKIADYAQQKYGAQIVLCGGPSDIEQQYGQSIMQQTACSPVNLIGKTSLKQLLAILKQAQLVVAPDAGPAHLANAVGTPVIGLYATTNPDRARPYCYPEYVVNRYPEAVKAKYGQSITDLPWGIRVRDEGTMARIQVQDVTDMIDKFFLTTQTTGQPS